MVNSNSSEEGSYKAAVGASDNGCDYRHTFPYFSIFAVTDCCNVVPTTPPCASSSSVSDLNESESASPAPLRGGHHVQLLQGALELFPALVRAIRGAQSSIYLETYIFDPTGSAALIAQALMHAAQRGVDTRLVVDGVGTSKLPTPWSAQLQAAGVQMRVYSPLGPLGLLLPTRWRRLHRKLCVVDGQTLFCGGINVLDDHHDPHYGCLPAPRFDFAVRVQGVLVTQARDAMEQLWWRMQAVQDARQYHLVQAVRALREAQAAQHRIPSRWGMRAALLLRDNLRNRTRIERAYRSAIARAQEEIIIANAYFLPGRKLRRALILAAQRGVQVQLLLQGRYEYFMQYHAVRPVYRALLEAGVQIYEYAPSFLHAKVAVIDAQAPRPWATVGSSNLDPLSLLLAREANVVVRDTRFAKELRQRLHQAMHDAGEQIDPKQWQQRPWHQRALDRFAFALMRMALWLTGNRY